MAKKNLALELGTRYVAEFYNGALFVHEGKLCRIINVGDGGVHVEFVMLENPTDWEGVFLPVDVLTNFAKFQWPTLGYRQIQTKRYGTCVMHISANRSAHRGLRHEHLHIEALAPVRRLANAQYEWEAQPQSHTLVQVFNPTFTKFADGVKLLLAGDIPSFAVSPHLAVGLSVDQGEDRAYDIYFRQKVVGSITDEGNVTISNKIIQRDSVRTALFG